MRIAKRIERMVKNHKIELQNDNNTNCSIATHQDGIFQKSAFLL